MTHLIQLTSFKTGAACFIDPLKIRIIKENPLDPADAYSEEIAKHTVVICEGDTTILVEESSLEVYAYIEEWYNDRARAVQNDRKQ